MTGLYYWHCLSGFIQDPPDQEDWYQKFLRCLLEVHHASVGEAGVQRASLHRPSFDASAPAEESSSAGPASGLSLTRAHPGFGFGVSRTLVSRTAGPAWTWFWRSPDGVRACLLRLSGAAWSLPLTPPPLSVLAA